MREIAEYCQTSVKTLRCWIRYHDFPAAVMGRRWESDVKLIQEWRRTAIKNGGIPMDNYIDDEKFDEDFEE
ncbi:MAG: helix-turn-helix domain-containing protein [Massilibacteroides sp.]|nr:helix-turn-helix domain-containing protein [Massilibacteroides sp.]